MWVGINLSEEPAAPISYPEDESSNASETSVTTLMFTIIFIYYNLVVTWWQWLFYMYTEYEIGY